MSGNQRPSLLSWIYEEWLRTISRSPRPTVYIYPHLHTRCFVSVNSRYKNYACTPKVWRKRPTLLLRNPTSNLSRGRFCGTGVRVCWDIHQIMRFCLSHSLYYIYIHIVIIITAYSMYVLIIIPYIAILSKFYQVSSATCINFCISKRWIDLLYLFFAVLGRGFWCHSLYYN